MNKLTKLKFFSYLLLCLVFSSCDNGDDVIEVEPETCNYKLKIAYKWYNTYTTTDVYTDANRKSKVSSTITSPVGFLKIEPTGTYEIVSDDVALIGKWEFNKENCKLLLDDVSIKSVKIEFDILDVSTNTLTIKRIEGNKVYTQHYKTASCPTTVQLSKQWDNNKTYFFYYNASTNAITFPYVDFPNGYFKLNTDLTYNVMSNGVPLNGSWKLGEPYCTLDLDATKPLARSFEVVKITTDSLVIWRKDAVAGLAYLQYYLKH